MIQGSKKQTVILADDHPGFREGIKHYFENMENFKILGDVSDGQSCLDLTKQYQPDWAIVDLAMPKLNGFEVLSEALECGYRTKFIVVSMYAETAYAQKARELGAAAFIAKEDAISELDKALRSDPGQFFTSISVGRPTKPLIDQDSTNSIADLTKTENIILQYLSEGYTSREIALALEVSPRTIQKHRQNMSHKLGLHGPNRLLEFAVKNINRLKRQNPSD